MKIYNALDLKRGAVVNKRETFNSHVQPAQMIKDSEKDEQWKMWNMDWLENVGLAQIRAKSKRLTKNYKLAAGKIDKSDYIIGEGNEMSELVDYLTKEDESALEIKFYPVIPPVINVLLGEFSKRNTRPVIKASDDFSINEALEEKKGMVQERLMTIARQKVIENLIAEGIDGDTEEEVQIIQQQIEQLKSLPEIEQFMRKSYKNIVTEWAEHQLAYDEERFHMYELESLAFSDALITGTEFWHISMREDDYEVEVWNPKFTFFHKSPDVRYVSLGNYAGNIQLYTAGDIIDKFGYLMNEEQILSLETNYPNLNRGLISDGRPFDSFYDTSIPHDKQVPSQNLWFNKEVSIAAYKNQLKTDDLLYSLNNTQNDMFERQGLIRVTQAYWIGMKWVALLTTIDEEGNIETDWVDETFQTTVEPIYNTTVSNAKTADNLLYGQHLEPIYIKQAWKGIKIGSANSGIYGRTSPGSAPIYLDVKPLPFQLKGDYSVYGARLPVEGCSLSDRNNVDISLVDLMKPYQIAFNIVNNQISDILIDELGTVITIDTNLLPKYSMGEEWGKGNLAKGYQSMKQFQILPFDHSIDNTEERINYNQGTVLDMSQTQRLLGRIELARYFREEAFAAVGISPQRVGEVAASETATGSMQAVNNSYSQTEMYFVKHINFLMPRVKEMILNVAQYYHVNKPSVQLSYITSNEEQQFFELEGTKLLARDFAVFCDQKPDSKAILDQLKNLAIQNNTSGASLYDLAEILSANTPSKVISILRASERRMQEQIANEQTHEQEMIRAQQESAAMLQQQQQEFEASENQKDRDTQIYEAQIRASATANLADSDDSGLPWAKQIADEYFTNQDLSLRQRQQDSKDNLEREKIGMKKREIASKEKIAAIQLKIAKENQTKAEITKRQAAKNKKKQ